MRYSTLAPRVVIGYALMLFKARTGSRTFEGPPGQLVQLQDRSRMQGAHMFVQIQIWTRG
jgi:hypothetical protein